jgi:biopolymer transport protein ExbB
VTVTLLLSLAIPAAAEFSSAADSSAADAVSLPAKTNAFDRYVLQGGWVTIWLLLPISIAALSLIIKNWIHPQRITVLPTATIEAVCDLLQRGQYAAAIDTCAQDPSVLAQIIHGGFRGASEGLATVKRQMEQQVDEHAVLLLRRLEYLNLLGHVAPMVGLFGTVQGIINMFGSISESGGIPVMSRISEDLGTALVATFWGLLIAIPSLSFFTLLRGRVDVFVQQSTMAIDKVLLALKRKPAAAPAAQRPAKATQLVG